MSQRIFGSILAASLGALSCTESASILDAARTTDPVPDVAVISSPRERSSDETTWAAHSDAGHPADDPSALPARIRPARAPAYPLISSDPYFSVWSFSDPLCASWPRHWTGAIQALVSMVRVDGRAHRLMGLMPDSIPCAQQTAVRISPTRTVYDFDVPGVRVQLTFLTPRLADDLDLLAQPITYLTWDVKASDGRSHDVAIYFDHSAELVTDQTSQMVTWEEVPTPGLLTRRIGTVDQPILAKRGDFVRIDWGHLYQSTVAGPGVAQVAAADLAARQGFLAGNLPTTDDSRRPRAAQDEWPVLATTFELPGVGDAWVSRTVMLAYDDEYSVELMGTRLRPYWRRDTADAPELLGRAAAAHPAVLNRSKDFDREFTRDLDQVGGPSFLRLATLAYRQAMAAHKLVEGPNGEALFFSKENASNGCISTVDVTYPSAPLFLLLNPELVKGMITPIADYAASPRWRFDFAPHDLGTYPVANGQVYGGGETSETNQMPVEESANLILLFAGVAKVEGNIDYAVRYWSSIATWASYLEAQGFDPASQLSTDDFAGHLAHNANLSVKAILALGSYGRLLAAKGDQAEADRIDGVAREFAGRWVQSADDGDHTRLAFDAPGTWSQKYNLVWDCLLDLGLFSEAVIDREVAAARDRLTTYGLPLDSRRSYTKLDWTVWTASLSGRKTDLEAFMRPLARFLEESPSRVPLTDWYETNDGSQVGFQARSVVGGVFLPMLYDAATWQKWSSRARSP